MKTVSIIGFGRFGKTLYRLLKNDFQFILFDNDITVFDNVELTPNTQIAASIADVFQISESSSFHTIFYCVPISAFESIIADHQKLFKPDHLIMDVLSVKVHTKNVLTKYLQNTNTQAILTHPMFGPDSSQNGFENLPIVIDQFLASNKQYSFWKEYFESKQLKVVEMSADEHDKLAANSQGVTHFIGRLLDEVGFEPTMIDTLGAKKLYDVKTQTCNDTWELFSDLQNYNPYTKEMRDKLGKAYDKLYEKLG